MAGTPTRVMGLLIPTCTSQAAHIQHACDAGKQCATMALTRQPIGRACTGVVLLYDNIRIVYHDNVSLKRLSCIAQSWHYYAQTVPLFWVMLRGLVVKRLQHSKQNSRAVVRSVGFLFRSFRMGFRKIPSFALSFAVSRSSSHGRMRDSSDS